METFYLCVVVFLFVLAIFDLWVGVSNDAVNFLNSAIGAKAFPFKVIIIIAAVGVFCGAALSNGMMEVARHGIFQPQFFTLSEIICILLAVMVTDVVLLDVFNNLGLPTSTTVSLVFELLGGTVALALYKSLGSDNPVALAEMINTDKAFSVVLAIFVSVGIAFAVGIIVQWLTRLIFTFNYKSHLKWFIGLFGGMAATAIVYFMLIKGVKDLSFMTPENKVWVSEHSGRIVLYCLAGFSVLMQVLHWCRVNVFKVIVMMGTFALAMAFAGNDLVNFIGVPLTGFSAYSDYVANGQGVGASNYLMTSLNQTAQTPIIFLLGAGLIMVISLIASKKAHNVVKTSLNLSRQEDGDELFGSSMLARKLVRNTTTVNNTCQKLLPGKVTTWVDSRFNKDEAIMAKGASFDLIRASVNLVLAGLLVALGTSMKLPLSTTYVTFMVAMGTSLADRAWARESAVFRITGVISVIGGWFITAGVALTVCFIVATAMHFGGVVVMVLMGFLAIFLLVRSHIRYNRKQASEKQDTLFSRMMNTKDKAQIWTLLKQHMNQTVCSETAFAAEAYQRMTEAFMNEDLKEMHRAARYIDEEREEFKKTKRREMLNLRRIEPTVAVAHNTWFHMLRNTTAQLIYCLKRMYEPCMEHLDNHFNPLPSDCESQFRPLRNRLVGLLQKTEQALKGKEPLETIHAGTPLLREANILYNDFDEAMDIQAQRMQQADNNYNLNIYIVYMNMLQESHQLTRTLQDLLHAPELIKIV